MRPGDLVAIRSPSPMGMIEGLGIIICEAPEYEGMIEPRLLHVLDPRGYIFEAFEDELTIIGEGNRL